MILNFPIGQLCINPQGTIEFKSNNQNLELIQFLSGNDDLYNATYTEGQDLRAKSYNRSSIYKNNKSKIKNMFKSNTNDVENAYKP